MRPSKNAFTRAFVAKERAANEYMGDPFGGRAILGERKKLGRQSLNESAFEKGL